MNGEVQNYLPKKPKKIFKKKLQPLKIHPPSKRPKSIQKESNTGDQCVNTVFTLDAKS